MKWGVKYFGVPLSTAAVLLVAWYMVRPLPPLRVESYSRLTYDGQTKKLGGTDGNQLYFTFDYASLAKISVKGGEVTPIATSVSGKGYRVLDVSHDGSELLVGVANEKDSAGYPFRSLCTLPTQNGVAHCYAEGHRGSFSPDDSSIAYLNLEHEIHVVRTTEGDDRKIMAIGPTAFDLRWSPDGKKIRFANAGSIWEMQSDGKGLHQVISETYGLNELGRWSLDGNVYAFLHTEPFANQIWILDERRRFWQSPSVPIPLTNGPISWDIPTPSPDGKHIYAIGEVIRGELVRALPYTSQLVPS